MSRSRNTNPQSSSPPACANIGSLRKSLARKREERKTAIYLELCQAANDLAVTGTFLMCGFAPTGKRKFCIHSYKRFAPQYRKQSENYLRLKEEWTNLNS